MTAMLVGRGAVVTGAGRGIGAAIAGALARAGASVMVAARTGAEVEHFAAALREGGARAWAATCDVSVEADVVALGRVARERLGHVDVLVNNAGVATSGPFQRLTLEEWNRMLAVHATGTFLCTREFAPDMIERGWGRIVNVASVAGLAGARYVAHYSAAKHAVVGFTRSVALEIEGTGVSIHAVCPAYVDTPMTESTVANVQSRAGLPRERALAAVLATTGQSRLVTQAEVADAVLALCGPDGASRNGAAIVLDTGVTPP